MFLVANLRTHNAVLRDGKKIPLTEEQYNNIVIAKQDAKPSEFINLIDPDTKKSMYHGEIGQIKEFEEIRRQNLGSRGYFCEFGIRHGLQETCGCKERFGMAPSSFRSKAIEIAGKYVYNDEITDELREKVLLADSEKV